MDVVDQVNADSEREQIRNKARLDMQPYIDVLMRDREFDCVILQRPTGSLEGTLALERLHGNAGEGPYPMGLSFLEIDEVVQSINKAGGRSLAVPSRYRVRHVHREEAKEIAIQFISSRMVGNPERYGPLVEEECLRYWVFEVEDYDAQEQGVSPGIIRAHVDYCDGHIWTLPEEYAVGEFERIMRERR